jgi:glutaredoxin
MITKKSAATSQIKTLSLYYYDSCPFCQITLKALKETGLDVELRNIQRQSHYRSELIKQGGSAQVPCLRIDLDDGKTTWLYESRDIIHFMRSYASELELA